MKISISFSIVLLAFGLNLSGAKSENTKESTDTPKMYTSPARALEIREYLQDFERKCLTTINNRIKDPAISTAKKDDYIKLRLLLTNGYSQIENKLLTSRLSTQFYWDYQIDITKFVEKEFNNPEIWIIPKPSEFNIKGETNRDMLASYVKWQILNRISFAALNYEQSPQEVNGAINYYNREINRLQMTDFELKTLIASAKRNSNR